MLVLCHEHTFEKNISNGFIEIIYIALTFPYVDINKMCFDQRPPLYLSTQSIHLIN